MTEDRENYNVLERDLVFRATHGISKKLIERLFTV